MQGSSLFIPTSPPRRDAFDLASALDGYEATTRRLVETWFDMHVAQAFSRDMERIRERALATPELSLLALQLGIAHCELANALWHRSDVSAEAMEQALQRHALALATLRAAIAAAPAVFLPVVEPTSRAGAG